MITKTMVRLTALHDAVTILKDARIEAETGFDWRAKQVAWLRLSNAINYLQSESSKQYQVMHRELRKSGKGTR